MDLSKKIHTGKGIAKKGKFIVIDCTVCGFKHLDPVPTPKELSEFYQKRYYGLIKKGGRAPEIRRQISKEKEAKTEIGWLRRTLFEEVRSVLAEYSPQQKRKKMLLDIGCGTGEFMRYMKNAGWHVTGIEPSEERMKAVSGSGSTIYRTTLENFMIKHKKYTFDAIILLNVLEHVPHPVEFLRHAKGLLNPRGGLLCIRVPNDFNELQMHAEKRLNKRSWWVAIPDHINYFNFESLRTLAGSLGLEVLYLSADFPMEMYLLMGEDYIGNQKIGNICHKKRIRFELSIPGILRRKIYQNLANAGIGRDCIMLAKIKQ